MKSPLRRAGAWLVALLLGCFATHRADAQNTNYWYGAGSDTLWTTAANWSNSIVPVFNTSVILTNFGTSGLPGTNGSGAVGTANINVAADTRAASMWVKNTNTATMFHTIQIASGATLTISNSAVHTNIIEVVSQSGAGAPSAIGSDYSINALIYHTIQGAGGRLAVISTNGSTVFARGNIFVGQGSSGTAGALNAVLDLSGLDNFDADVNHILLGDGGIAGYFINRPVGTIYFAKTNNLRLWAAGNHPSAGGNANGGLLTGISAQNGDSARAGRFFLGYTNAILCNSGITMGSRGFGGWLGFNPSNDPGVSVAYFRNLLNNGGRQTRWSIADRLGAGNGASQNIACELDFSRGTVDALVGTLTIGVNNQINGLTGSVEFGAGTIDVNALQIGVQSASTGFAQGTLTVSNTAVLRVNTSGTLGGAVGTLAPTYFARLIVTNGGTAIFSNVAPITCGQGASTEIYVANSSALSVFSIGTLSAPLGYLQLANSTLTADRGVASNGGIIYVNNLDLSGANTINMLGTVLVVGQFPIIKYSSIVNGGFANLTLGSVSPGITGFLSNNVANSSIDFVVTSSTTAVLTWDGQTNGVPIGNWDINITPDWKGAAKYLQPSIPGSLVTFDDTALGTTTVIITNQVAPAILTIANTLKNYTFNGTNITGPTTLTKDGSGSLTLNNNIPHTFTGSVFLNDGIINNGGNGNTLPVASSIIIQNTATAGINLNNLPLTVGVLSGAGTTGGNVNLGSGTLNLSSGSGTYGGIISGAGRLLKTGNGTEILTGANNYSGGTFITNAGLVVYANSGLGSGPVLISTNGALQLGNGPAGGSDGMLSQAVITNFNGTLSLFPSASYTFTNQVVSSSSGSFVKLIGGTDFTTIFITNANPMLGTANIQQGSIQISHPAALGTGGIVVGNATASDTYLGLSGGINVTNPITLSGKTGALVPSPVGINSLSETNALYGNITLLGSTCWSIGAESGSKLIVNGTIVNSGAAGFGQLYLRGSGEGLFNSAIVNSAGNTVIVFKEDSGQWTLAGNNTYTGRTEVNGGTLIVNGTVRGSVFCLSSTFGGKGLITGAVTNGGTFLPGGDSTIGTMTISNQLVLSGATVNIDLGPTGNDQVRGLTSVDFGGSTIVINTNGILTGNCIFKLFDAASYTGAYTIVRPDITSLGLDWDESYFAVDGTLRVTNGVAVTPAISSVARNVNGTVQLTGTGTLVAPFSILATTNLAEPLINWVNLGGGTFSNGTFNFLDTTAAGLPARFYLLTTPTP